MMKERGEEPLGLQWVGMEREVEGLLTEAWNTGLGTRLLFWGQQLSALRDSALETLVPWGWDRTRESSLARAPLQVTLQLVGRGKALRRSAQRERLWPAAS